MFKRSRRQEIIDDYLANTGRNIFTAGEFVDWLSERPDHECYDLFFGKSDEEAAREYRIGLARRMVSGLRIVAKVSSAPDKANVISIAVREYPAYVSPLSGRRGGGGYVAMDPDDPDMMNELRRQGAASLVGWLGRYRGAFEAAGYDLTVIEDMVQSTRAEAV